MSCTHTFETELKLNVINSTHTYIEQAWLLLLYMYGSSYKNKTKSALCVTT